MEGGMGSRAREREMLLLLHPQGMLGLCCWQREMLPEYMLINEIRRYSTKNPNSVTRPLHLEHVLLLECTNTCVLNAVNAP